MAGVFNRGSFFNLGDEGIMKSKLMILAAGLMAAAGGAQAAVDAKAAEALAQKSNCLACHTVDKKLVGPAYKDIAAKYKGDKGAEAKQIGRASCRERV